MRQVLWRRRWQWIGLLVLLVVVLLVSLLPVPYRTTAPGYNNEVGDFITIEGAYDTAGHFHTTSVIVLNRTTLLQRWIGQFEERVDVREQPDYFQDIDISDLRVSGFLSKDDSLNNSLVVAIQAAGRTIEYVQESMVYLTYNILDPDTLELGDILLAVNGSTDVIETLSAVACGDTATVLVRRDERELTFSITRHEQDDGSCTFGLSVRTFTDILSTDVNYTLHDSLTGGSSGGLLQALHIFNLLTPNDITGGQRIAGTGTIDVDGNVGAIGGVRQKIITSAMNGIDVFFVPHLSDAETDNYIVAQAVLATLETDMILVPVTSFDDAVAYLASRFGGAFDE